MTSEKTYICIRCSGMKEACSLHTRMRQLPCFCGPDANGYFKFCDWLEVPEKVETKQPR